jgi:hypothetical protein
MPGYVLRDWEIIDYSCYQLAGTSLWLRGPQPTSLEPGRYFTAIGAAQTFGCFCARPYPTLLAERLGMEALNLGYSGAGPAFFLRHPELIEYVNRSAFCVVQVMSGRSTSNSLLHNPDGLAYGKRTSDGAVSTAEAVFDDLLDRAMALLPIRSERLKKKLLRRSRLPLPSVRRVVLESRQNWMQEYRALMQAITVPTILLWFSKRTPFYIPQYHHRAALFRAFPQLVNASMVHRTKKLATHYVECVTQQGSPQPLVSRFTGKPTTVDLARDIKPVAADASHGASLYKGRWKTNSYYPSPEMHADAADALEATCRSLWNA